MPRTLIPLRPNLGVLQIGIKSQGYREPVTLKARSWSFPYEDFPYQEAARPSCWAGPSSSLGVSGDPTTRAAMDQRTSILQPSFYSFTTSSRDATIITYTTTYTIHYCKAKIPEADMPPQKRLLLSAPIPRVEVRESSTAAAATRQPGSTMAHRAQEDRGVVRAEIEILRRERLAYEQESIKTHQALARARTADDRAMEHIIRTQALEAGARVDTLEDTNSSA
ncbi:hypothetical protein Tco_0487432 [Tanacetum coccineum]